MSKLAIRLFAFANLLLFVGTVAVNALANALPINGRRTGEISDSLPNLFVPAGVTFSIWGLIYLSLGIWVVWQCVAAVRLSEPGVGMIERVAVWFILGSAANIGWIFAWHHGRYGLSLILMLVLLISLVAVYQNLGIGRGPLPLRTRVPGHWPFSIYLGWISVATVANVTALLVHLGWNGFGLSEVFWASLMILIAVSLGILALGMRRDYAYALVILWALAGIVLARIQGPNPQPVVAIVAGAGAGVLLMTMALLLGRRFS